MRDHVSRAVLCGAFPAEVLMAHKRSVAVHQIDVASSTATHEATIDTDTHGFDDPTPEAIRNGRTCQAASAVGAPTSGRGRPAGGCCRRPMAGGARMLPPGRATNTRSRQRPPRDLATAVTRRSSRSAPPRDRPAGPAPGAVGGASRAAPRWPARPRQDRRRHGWNAADPNRGCRRRLGHFVDGTSWAQGGTRRFTASCLGGVEGSAACSATSRTSGGNPKHPAAGGAG